MCIWMCKKCYNPVFYMIRFRPQVDEPTLNKEDLDLAARPERKSLFKGKTFVFFNSKQASALLSSLLLHGSFKCFTVFLIFQLPHLQVCYSRRQEIILTGFFYNINIMSFMTLYLQMIESICPVVTFERVFSLKTKLSVCIRYKWANKIFQNLISCPGFFMCQVAV